jgi:hypothetical protein
MEPERLSPCSQQNITGKKDSEEMKIKVGGRDGGETKTTTTKKEKFCLYRDILPLLTF